MAFGLQHWACSTASANTSYVLPASGTAVDANIQGAPTVYTYFSDGDAQATIAAANYFSTVAADLKLHDVIYASGSDADVWYSVTAINYAATPPTVTISAFSLAGPVGTANIQDLAVTTGKIDDLGVTTGKIAANAVTTAKLDPTTVQYALVTCSTAEVLALRAAPKTLVAAPGADKIISLVGAMLVLDYNSIAYTESADNMAIRYTDGSGVIVSQAIEATGFIDQTADTATNALAKIDGIAAATGCVNKAIVLHNTGGDEYAAGNSPVDVHVWYRVIPAGL